MTKGLMDSRQPSSAVKGVKRSMLTLLSSLHYTFVTRSYLSLHLGDKNVKRTSCTFVSLD